MDQAEIALELKDLTIDFQTSAGLLHAVRGVNLQLRRGQTLAIVGESGSGKSVTARAVTGLFASNEMVRGGEILYTDIKDGKPRTADLLKIGKRELYNRFCGKRIAMVFQDPMAALDPVLTIGRQLTEGMRRHLKLNGRQANQRALELLAEVGIVNPALAMKSYPHQLSGGMRQRVVIAIALACDPDILICDEPTTALDVTIQAKILELIQKLQRERSLSVIYITHDMGVVAKVADYVVIMYAGKIVEQGTAQEIYFAPRHPYTWGLLLAIPDLDTDSEKLYTIPGVPPAMTAEIAGDAFAPRNQYALKIDFELEPPEFQVTETHKVCSWLLDGRAPAVSMPAGLEQRMEKMRAAANRM